MAKNHYKGAFVSDCLEFPDIYISQGSVEMCFEVWWDLKRVFHCKFTAEFMGSSTVSCFFDSQGIITFV